MEEIRINQQYNEVQVRGEKIELSNIEYHILLLLMQNPKKIFSAQNLYESVWDEPYFYNCNSTVMVHIRKLRVKIEKSPQEPRYISTVWGKGYRFGTKGENELQFHVFSFWGMRHYSTSVGGCIVRFIAKCREGPS